MQESDTYLMILEEGEAMGIRKIILIQGEDRFGPPDDAIKAGLNIINDLERLMRMARKTQKAANWQEILETP